MSNSSDILISLPQIGHAEDVDKASAIANVRVRLVKKGAEGGDVNTSGVCSDVFARHQTSSTDKLIFTGRDDTKSI